ncbi:MAG TPA: peptidase T [Acholeplasma sp.]|jgi:tripeptide aminopeptidase|nr:peptidase T [Acholeplasma sp.]
MDIVKRFINYAKIDTQSDPNSDTIPSTSKQKDLSRLLVEELKEMKLDAFMDKYGYVYAKIPANTKGKRPVGFIAHVDTSYDAPGNNVKPRIIKNYQGEEIVLNEQYKMSPDKFDCLNDVIGDDIIVTDGNTLLGADNKAGVAIIMDLAQKLTKDNSILHGDVYIGFTPDEEIGRGPHKFDLDYFKPDFAYTIDGGKVGGLNYENFNASSADIKFIGKSIHPGTAKNKMINAIHLAMEFHSMLPTFKNPAYTEKREGFNHLSSIKGSVEEATVHYIIRNHDYNEFKQQEKEFETIKNYLNNKYGYEAVHLTIKESYLNMYEVLKKDMTPVKIAEEATKKANVTPFASPMRGGTDGAQLTYMGLPCPNLGTGGYNYHGRYEFLSINQMKKVVEILLEIIKLL